MAVKDTLPIVISTISFAMSLATFFVTYFPKDNALISTLLPSRLEADDNMTYPMVLSVSIVNNGNRPVLLSSYELQLFGDADKDAIEKYRVLEKDIYGA